MVQPAVHQVIVVIAVWDLLVAAALVLAATGQRGAHRRVGGADLDDVLVIVIPVV